MLLQALHIDIEMKIYMKKLLGHRAVVFWVDCSFFSDTTSARAFSRNGL